MPCEDRQGRRRTLASLHAAGYLPEIWTPDAATERMRRLVARRYQVVRHRTRIKNEVHAILHAHLIPKRPYADLFNVRGRASPRSFLSEHGRFRLMKQAEMGPPASQTIRPPLRQQNLPRADSRTATGDARVVHISSALLRTEQLRATIRAARSVNGTSTMPAAS